MKLLSRHLGAMLMQKRKWIGVLALLAGAIVLPGCRREPRIAPPLEPESGALERKTAGTNNSPSAPNLIATRGWNQLRGNDQGRCMPEEHPPLVWSETSNVVWKTEIPGT